ncbi:multidrug resistance-associated ABC transporter [Phanerochaete sordida]|uniref:Multidrug resistance-associated ABC transporter n=1 Tax=Phanerochaete sordida TaxID=48140 RepID=A0A9P3GSN4_9APHY|nr:multidrug resistance-associated ABC transporter [Phanerochaete sordida]
MDVVGGGVHDVLRTALQSQHASHLPLPVAVTSAAIALALVHVGYGLYHSRRTSKLTPKAAGFDSSTSGGLAGSISRHVNRVGGPAIFVHKLLRFTASTALLVLVVITAARHGWSTLDRVLLEALAFVTVLAAASVLVSAKTYRLLSPYGTVFAFAVFASYAYRDIWPLMTFTLHPRDSAEGPILWVKVGLSMWTGLLGPLLEPFPYIPVFPERPGNKPSPEQTTSAVSLIIWTFLDPLVWRAYRVPHLSHDQLPPLADYDEAEYLIQQNFGHLDPFSGAKKKGSLLWPILKIIRIPMIYQTICGLILPIFRLAGPIGVNRLLNYLETSGENAVVRPWVWICVITIGPIGDTLLKELSLFFSTRSLIRVEAILTTLIFDHALRLRVKAEVDAKPEQTDASTGQKSGEQPKAREKAASVTGKLMNMATSDMNNITGGRNFLSLFIGTPLGIISSMWFLYALFGWSSLVGLAVMLILFFVPGRITAAMSVAQKEKMKATDSRVQLVTESLGVLRMIKLFGWETRVEQEVAVKRESELKWVWRSIILSLSTFNFNRMIPLIQMIVTYAVYALVQKRTLTASIVFSSISVFGSMRIQFHFISQMAPVLVTAYVSIGRLRDFLWDTELLDSFDEKDTAPHAAVSAAHERDIGFGRSVFAWSADAASSGSAQPSFRLRIQDDVVFKHGCLNLVIGPTGSGKTSVLMALLGEMHRVPLNGEAWANLPRENGVAYAAQESWVLSDTIKENILFGSQYDEDRYKKVIHQCALTTDLALFDAGDETQVGERGITLSGGQKARVTLARAVYSSAEILLLDDVIAALDAHTARWVVDKCFRGDLMKSRTIILVTHNLALTAPLAKFVVSLGPNGSIQSKGTVVDVLGATPGLAEEVAHEAEALELDASESETKDADPADTKDGKLIVPEEIAIGRVNRSSYKLYVGGMGGLLFWAAYVGTEGMAAFCTLVSQWWLGWWATQYAFRDPEDVDVPYYLGVYSLLFLLIAVFQFGQSFVDAIGRIKASRVIHEKLMSSVFGSTFRWLDVTPTSRILTRCTQDMQAVDAAVPAALYVVVAVTIQLIARLAVLVLYAPIFLLPAAVVIMFGLWLGTVYIKVQLSVKREMSNRKAPVLDLYGSAIHGLVSIRAYAAQGAFREQLLKRVNEYTRAGRTFWLLNRWIAVRLDSLSAIFSASIATYFVYYSTMDSSAIGFMLVNATSFTNIVLNLVHWGNQLEVAANSLERLSQYVEAPQEPRDGTPPPAHWPSSGSLSVERLSASYTFDGPKILQDLTFNIKSGEHIGVVGRTGAGKSTLTLALLRCIHTQGLFVYDGVRTDSIPLDSLRSSITIIPQSPELMGGTLRHNLDPFAQHDDATLNDALRSAGLFSLQQASDENRITLDTNVAGGGANLSVGQRQIIALARAIVRQSKLLILDEATSAIDYETDAVIQQSLRKELRSDVTVITVAHRLQTIMDYDKIMVLDAGRLVEFDTPRALLQKKDGLLYALVEQSADKDLLYIAAQGR